MKPLKIGYLVQQFPPEVGAGPARVTEMAAHWIAAGAEVTVFTGMPNRPQGVIHPSYRGKLHVAEEWNGIHVHRSWLYASPKGGFARTLANNSSFMLTGALTGLLRSRALDVLIASSPPFFVHAAGEAIRLFKRVPLILEIRDLWPDYLVGMGVVKSAAAKEVLFGVEKYLLQQAHELVVVTESFRRRIAEKGLALDRIHLIPNGVDTSFYRRAEEAPPMEPLRRRGEERIIGYLGNFGMSQGLGAVLDAADRLRGDASVRFVLAGDGSDRATLERLVHERALTNVTLHGAIPKDATRAFYNACDVCLVPLAGIAVLQETIPSKIFEVMACERPLVGALAGEGATLIERSGGGVAVEPGSGAAIADGIRRTLELPERERREMGRRGRAFVQEHYAREALAARYLQILRRVAGQEVT